MITYHSPESRTFLPGSRVKSNNLFGIEIELEDNEIDSIQAEYRYWNIHEDHSLRGEMAREFVLRQPLTGHDIEAALTEIEPYIQASTASSRCSIHVHVDIRAWTKPHFNSFVAHWLAFERMLVKFSGGREENIFCFPYYRTQDFHAMEAVFNASMLQGEGCKYTSLNFVPSQELGSIEVRTHRGTTNTEEILQWIEVLSELIEYTRSTEADLSKLPEFFSGKGPLEFLRDVFPTTWERLTYPKVATDLLTGIRDVQFFLKQQQTNYFHVSPKSHAFKCDDDLFTKWNNKRTS